MNREEYARMYAHEQHLWWYQGMRAISAAMLDRVGLTPGRGLDILDAGCGTGATMQWLMRYGHVTGIDLSEDALSYCRKRRLERVVGGSIEALPFADASFDLITTFDVLYHQRVMNEQRALGEFRRVLRPGGSLLVRVPALQSLYGRHDVAVQTRHRYRRGEVVAALTGTGFIVEHATYANTLLLPVVLGKRLAERWTEEAPSDLDATPRWLDAIFGNALRIEAALIRRLSLPYGVSVTAIARRTGTPDDASTREKCPCSKRLVDGARRLEGSPVAIENRRE